MAGGAITLVDRVTRRLGEDLSATEVVRHAVPAFEYGGARRIVTHDARAGGNFLVAGLMQTIEGRDAPAPPADLIPVPKRCIVALTSHRLLIFVDRAIASHVPTRKVHDFPLPDIIWVGTPARAGRLTIADRVVVGLVDGRSLGWEFPRLSIAAGQQLMGDFIAAVNAIHPGRPGPDPGQ